MAPIGTGCNAVIVKQTANVKTTFAAIPPFGFASFTVSATSVASARGGAAKPLDVAVVVDSTASMNGACGDTVPGISGTADKIDCAKEGVRTLLNGLWPCGQGFQSCSGESSLDQASLLTFPGLKDANAYTHDTTTPPLFTNDNLEFGCPGNYSSAPFWYQNSGGNGDEVQKVTVNALTFKLTFGGSSTATLTKGTTTAAVLQADLQGLSSIGAGNVSVTGGTGGPYTVTFVGNLGNQNIPAMTGTANVSITTPTAGAAYDSNGFPGWNIETSDLTYSGSPDYVITPLSNDFKTSDSSALNDSSDLVSAVNWNTCAGGTYPGNEYYGLNSRGGVSTYYAGAISAAQAELAADSARGAQPVIILLSDGDANTQSPGQCSRAVQAAQSAAAAGTWVYSVMYGQTSTSGGCSGDGSYTAYTAMKAIASDPAKFFCDPQPVGASCQTAATLNDIFVHIAEDVTTARLIG